MQNNVFLKLKNTLAVVKTKINIYVNISSDRVLQLEGVT